MHGFQKGLNYGLSVAHHDDHHLHSEVADFEHEFLHHEGLEQHNPDYPTYVQSEHPHRFAGQEVPMFHPSEASLHDFEMEHHMKHLPEFDHPHSYLVEETHHTEEPHHDHLRDIEHFLTHQ